MTDIKCPNCGHQGMEIFYEVAGMPVHSVLLMRTREQALSYPKGEIHLAHCDNCGFILNSAFDASLHEYSGEYEATQSYSPTFNAFNTALALRLIDTYDLHDKAIIEIGCGHGEFLILLCELGPNQGVGFDPAYIDRIQHPAKERIKFVQDFYSEKYTAVQGDFFVCKMTLEHIPNTAEFMATVRRSIGERVGTRVFFQIPNASYVLNDVAFWDVYYEHCSYFSKASLAILFMQAGFEVTNIFTDYNDQYLMIEAVAGDSVDTDTSTAVAYYLEETRQDVEHFKMLIGERLAVWRAIFDEFSLAQEKAIIWGSGSKGVTFMTSLGITDEVEYVVDINPVKWGAFMPGSGHEIVGPEFLQDYDPDVVIVMNPIYVPEIQTQLEELALSPRILTVDAPVHAC